jgi:hypothetical protein
MPNHIYNNRFQELFQEKLDPVGQEDTDIDNDGKHNTSSDKYLLNRRVVRSREIQNKRIKKESFSNWRDDLFENFEEEEKEQNEKQIKEFKGKNKIKTSADPGGITIGEEFGSTGGVLVEFNEIEIVDIFSELNEHEISYLNDNLIDSIVEEFFYECLEEGYSIKELVDITIENIDIHCDMLSEAKVTYGHNTKGKSDRLQKVKSGIKRVGKALAKGTGYVAGATVRGVKAAGREFGSGYERGRKGSSSTRKSSGSGSGSVSSSSKKSSGSGLLSKIGSKLKKGLKGLVARSARSISRGARNIARKMEDDKGRIVTPDKTPPSPAHSRTGVRQPRPYSSTQSQTAPVGTPKNPRVGQPGPDKPTASTRRTPTRRSSTSSERRSRATKGQQLRREADKILASLKNEDFDNSNSFDSAVANTKKQLSTLDIRRAKLLTKIAKDKQQKEEYEILERKMTTSEKAKESRLKDKYDDSDMKQNMIDQYGKEEGTKIYFATIKKQSMSEETDDNIPELRSRTITDGPSSTTRRKTTSAVLARMRELNADVKKKKKKKKKKEVVESFGSLEEKKLSRTEKRAQSSGESSKRSKTLNLIDLDANAMKPKKKGVEAEIEVKKGGKTTKTLNPQQFNSYKFKDDEKPDFNQFRSSKVFKKTLKGNKPVRNLHRGGESAGLTARGGMDNNREVVKHVRSSGFNKKHGVKFKGVHFTGDVPGKNTDDKKMKVIKNLIKSKQPKTIKFSDDHAKNLDAPERFNKEGGKDKNKNRGSSTPKIKTYLTRDDGRPIRYGSGGGGVRNPKAVNKAKSPQETQRRRKQQKMGEEFGVE